MLFLLWKNSKYSEPICLTLALATHTKKIKSFDGKTGGSHKMLKSDVCHNYQCLKVSLINVTHIKTIGSCIFVKKTLSYVSNVFSMQTT